jgi:hypothetical protein
LKRFWQLLILSLAAFAVPNAVFAQSAGFNFVASDAGNPQAQPTTLASADVAGAVPQANWNNLDLANGSATTGIVYDNGLGTAVPSTINVTWASPNSWQSAGNNSFPAGSGNRALMAGYIDSNDQPGGGPMVTVTGIPAALRTPTYDVLVYFMSDSGEERRGGGYTLTPEGGTPVVKYGSTEGNPTTHTEDPGTDIDNTMDGTFLKFTGLSAPSFTLTADATLTMPAGFTNGLRAPIAGFQIVSFALPGDVNRDGQVNVADFHIIRGNLFKTGQTRAQGDLVGGDGVVGFADYREWKVRAGAGASAVALFGDGSVPEPAAGLVMACGAALASLAARRHQRKTLHSAL